MISMPYGAVGFLLAYLALSLLWYFVWCFRQDGKPDHMVGMIVMLLGFMTIACVAILRWVSHV